MAKVHGKTSRDLGEQPDPRLSRIWRRERGECENNRTELLQRFHEPKVCRGNSFFFLDLLKGSLKRGKLFLWHRENGCTLKNVDSLPQNSESDDEVIRVISITEKTSVATVKRATTENGQRVVVVETFHVDLDRGVLWGFVFQSASFCRVVALLGVPEHYSDD